MAYNMSDRTFRTAVSVELYRRYVPTIVSNNRRPWHQLDITALSTALRESPLCRPECWTHQSVDELALLYDSEITSLLDALAPVRAVNCRRRPSDAWFDKECRLSRRRVRRLERIAGKSETTEDNVNWTSERRAYRQLLQKKRQSFWKKKLDSEKSSPTSAVAVYRRTDGTRRYPCVRHNQCSAVPR